MDKRLPMEQKIKNFDRSIEKMMNETSVTPPFGMWNRISSALDTEALPIAAPAPTTAIPKSAIIGLVAGAFILAGSLLTAYLINNKSITPEEIVTTEVPEVVIPEQKIMEAPVAIEEVKPAVIAVTRKVAVTKPVIVETVKEEVPVVASNYVSNNEIGIPNQMLAQNTTATIDPYYFPPVDINNPVTAQAKVTPIEEDDDQPVVVEKKKMSSSSSREKKLRPKKKRPQGWNFGTINRYK